MANKRPEYFYHPVIGALSPTSLDVYFQKLAPPPVFIPSKNVSAEAPQEPPSLADAPSLSAPSPVEYIPAHPRYVVPDFSAYLPSPATQDSAKESLPPNSILDLVTEDPIPSPPPSVSRKAMSLAKSACCAITGEIRPTTEMIRFVISPSKEVVADLTNKLPGVFIWVGAERATLKKAMRRNSFASKAKDNAIIPPNLIEQIESGLMNMALQNIALAKRAGELSYGFMKVEAAIQSPDCALYIVAYDTRENGREKLERIAQHKNIPVIDLWSSDELSKIIGVDNARHVCINKCGLTQSILELVTKLKAVQSETL